MKKLFLICVMASTALNSYASKPSFSLKCGDADGNTINSFIEHGGPTRISIKHEDEIFDESNIVEKSISIAINGKKEDIGYEMFTQQRNKTFLVNYTFKNIEHDFAIRFEKKVKTINNTIMTCRAQIDPCSVIECSEH